MKKKVMMTSLMALALLISPLGSMDGLTRVSAEEQQAVSGNTQEKVQLDTPVNLQWGNGQSNPNAKYGIQWDGVNASTSKDGVARWAYEIRINEEEIVASGVRGVYGTGTKDASDLYYVDMHSGSYDFRVKALAAEGDERYQDSAWSAWSSKMEYVRPEQELGTLRAQWDEQKKGVCHVGFSDSISYEDAQKYVDLYKIILWKKTENGRYYVSDAWRHPFSENSVVDIDFSNEINRDIDQAGNGGQYFIEARAYSFRLDEIASGEMGPSSELLDITERIENTSNSTPGQSAGSDNSVQTELEGQLAAAVSGTTVKVTREQNISALSNSVMQMLVKRGDVALEMEYTYEGTDYHVIIPAGAAVDNEIAWYGPLYLSAYYSAADVQAPAEAAATYTVQGGDTLGKIARATGMTLSELTAKNPQIKNPNKIVPGQVIYIN